MTSVHACSWIFKVALPEKYITYLVNIHLLIMHQYTRTSTYKKASYTETKIPSVKTWNKCVNTYLPITDK
jgi:hypothetical protein